MEMKVGADGKRKMTRKKGSPTDESVIRRRNSLDLSFFQPGLKVWIENPYDEKTSGNYRRGEWGREHCTRPMYIPAHTTKNDPALGKVSVKTEFSPSLEIELPPSLVWPRNNETNLDDMIDFPHLHEAALLNVSVYFPVIFLPIFCSVYFPIFHFYFL
jgi:hypothetical protein